MPDSPLLLYSAGTWLAYSIAERFYGGVHYVWCSPYYDALTAARHLSIPPSSSPAEIYRVLEEDSRRGDRHSAAITKNRNGVHIGAAAMRAAGMMTEFEFSEATFIIDSADANQFRPVLYVIPFHCVRSGVVEVPAGQRASPFSVEYRIERLRNDSFDLLELRR